MQNQKDKTVETLYTSMKDTLGLIIFPNKGIDELIQTNLEELEGDYYTFLNPINVEKIFLKNLITKKTKEKLLQLFKIIHNLDSKKWTSNSFLSDNNWKQVRDLSNEIMDSFSEF